MEDENGFFTFFFILFPEVLCFDKNYAKKALAVVA